MVDAAEQRLNMVESQVRPSDVTDRAILRAMQDVPRERFVPPAMAALAYMDEAVPLPAAADGPRRWLMAPRVFGKLVQLARIGEGDRVLDVGAGLGYSAAVLAKLASQVVALESEAGLAKEATSLLSALGLANVTVQTGDLAAGCPDQGPFDAIVLEGSIGETPASLLDQLSDGGRLVAVVRSENLARAVVWLRSGSACDQRTAFDAAAPPLPGFQPAAAFVF